MGEYYKRFFTAFCKDFAKSAREQLIGALLVVAILVLQIHYGVINHAEIQGNAWAIAWPYVALILILFLFHLVRVPWKLDQEHQRVHQEDKNKISQAETECAQIREELQSVLDRADGPTIHLAWDVPKDFASLGVRNT